MKEKHSAVKSRTVLSLSMLTLFFFFSAMACDRDVRIAPYLLAVAAEVVVAAGYGAGTAFASYEVVAVFGLNLVTADITANHVANNQ